MKPLELNSLKINTTIKFVLFNLVHKTLKIGMGTNINVRPLELKSLKINTTIKFILFNLDHKTLKTNMGTNIKFACLMSEARAIG